RALGFGSDQEILDAVGDSEYIRRTLEKDSTESEEEALIEIYKRLRPGEPPAADNARQLLETLFFEPKRYDLMHVGRYRLNKKLALKRRIVGTSTVDRVVHPETGEVLAEAGVQIDKRLAEKIDAAGIDALTVRLRDGGLVRVVSNGQPDMKVK